MNLGVLVGGGELVEKSLSFLDKEYGSNLVVVGVKKQASPNLVKKYKHEWVNVWELKKVADFMLANNVTHMAMLGFVKRPSIIDLKLEPELISLVKLIMFHDKNSGDNALLTIVSNYFISRGIKMIAIQSIVPNLLSKHGCYSKKLPTELDFENIKSGFKTCKILGEYDIGQGLVIEQKTILSVEAIEGTDNLLKRTKKLSRNKSAIFIKTKKPNQDSRIDLPTVGDKTVINAYKSGIKGIVVESDCTFVLNEDKIKNLVNKYNMFFISITEESLKLNYTDFIAELSNEKTNIHNSR